MWFRRILRLAETSFAFNKTPVDHSQVEAALRLSAQAVRQLNRLQLRAGRYLPGTAAGLRPSLQRKLAYDFREHRKYVPGDDVRYVDWMASARQEHVFVKQGEHPKEATVYLLLDCSASLNWGQPPKYAAALSLAAALGYLALAQADRLVVYSLAQPAVRPFGPISGKGQVPALLNYLRSLPFQGQLRLERSLQEITRRARGGLVLLISDLLDVPDFSSILNNFPSPTWDVNVFHLLHPQELEPGLRGDFRMIDVESGATANYDLDGRALQLYQQQLDAWRAGLEQACVENNAFYTLIPAGWSLEREIIPHLRSVQVVAPR